MQRLNIKHALAILGTFLAFVRPAGGQDAEARTTKTILPCPFRIAAPMANFRMSFEYLLIAAPDGRIAEVTELSNSQRGSKLKFVHDELLVECMKKWRLEPAGRYSVSFYVGTTSVGSTSEPRDYMLITDPDRNKIKIQLFISDEQNRTAPQSLKSRRRKFTRPRSL